MSAWLMRVGWFLAESEPKRMAFSSNNIKHEREIHCPIMNIWWKYASIKSCSTITWDP